MKLTKAKNLFKKVFKNQFGIHIGMTLIALDLLIIILPITLSCLGILDKSCSEGGFVIMMTHTLGTLPLVLIGLIVAGFEALTSLAVSRPLEIILIIAAAPFAIFLGFFQFFLVGYIFGTILDFFKRQITRLFK